ncbi:hypothetical protein EGR_09850 [Echinococcus granulosus]|uniref:LITAF domain-containing protein n=1 Tax=Echinococcus granulosus TaxID=6210 RepID=W6U2E7_ECHGR|nr:hypothetical protein EGR_09850 [Echinococcus granulosus]EUB55285.1 hypothetical protein EGR_09850 [Echinococcus granulosus]
MDQVILICCVFILYLALSPGKTHSTMEQPPPPHTALPISEASKQGETQPSRTQTFGVDSRVAYCPTCRLKVNTIVDNQISTAKFLCLFVLCLITAPLFLFLIPFVSSGYQEVNHFCPYCSNLLGIFKSE